MSKIINVNRRTYPCEGRFTGVNVTVVLVEGGNDDYAAYVGVGSDDWIARHGDKLRFEEAIIHFPIGLKEEKYRR